jgi:hypothetical protein
VETPEILSRMANRDWAAERWSVQLDPDSMSEKRLDEVGQLYAGSKESTPLA